MTEDNKRQLADLQTSAVIVAGSMMVAFAVFWVIEIQGVLEMLELAYG